MNPLLEPRSISLPSYNRFASLINDANISNLVNVDIINGYRDVFGIDISMITRYMYMPGHNVQALGYYIDDVYQGCVWFFTSEEHPRYVGLYAIRSSIAQEERYCQEDNIPVHEWICEQHRYNSNTMATRSNASITPEDRIREA